MAEHTTSVLCGLLVVSRRARVISRDKPRGLRYPIEAATEIAVSNYVERLKERDLIEQITFACYNEEVFSTYERELEQRNCIRIERLRTTKDYGER
jgi:O-acetyl-ADP-ribose deacetylase (regulator of RNase III)